MLHVCGLASLHDTVEKSGASHVLTVISDGTPVERPETISEDNHLFLGFDDILAPLPDFRPPEVHHVEAILGFAERWPREDPMVVHCWAGVSRSTASAFSIVCMLHPDEPEDRIAHRLRKASPTATPNRLIVRYADHILGRNGRMLAAVDAIGRGSDLTFTAKPFSLWVD